MNEIQTQSQSDTESPSPEEHISDVRALLIEQLRVVKQAPIATLAEEIKRGRAMSELSQVIVNSAKVEVEYIQAVKGASESTFLQEKEEKRLPHIPTTPQSPLPSADAVTRIGPPNNHPWRAGITRHQLKG
ncbi:hypothetical protein HK414_12930 [Ramlibacter terrae]|uniref:Uncharacterized protein n=1 Tax=Ramlibacter terrae TaxID=2732511 RepID=A0ABX6P497_9BURK|nr:hypothetical protein HK414_12930 [Ramlibacter terrae]